VKILPARASSLKAAVQTLRAGGVVVFPTETSYGLAVDPRNAAAVKKLFRLKGRSASKTLSLIAADVAMVQSVATLSPREKKLCQKFWPGALTLILSPKKVVPRSVRSAKGVAIRVPANAFARSLAAAYAFPLTATSANRSQSPAAYSLKQFQAQFRKSATPPDIFLNAGRLPKRAASTLAQVRAREVVVLREGPVSLRQLERVVSSG
jgi:L-threonylcarbamoyladenylate synthase